MPRLWLAVAISIIASAASAVEPSKPRVAAVFVAPKLPAVGKAERTRELKQGAIRYASQAVTLGAAEDEALQHVRGAFADLLIRKPGGN